MVKNYTGIFSFQCSSNYINDLYKEPQHKPINIPPLPIHSFIVLTSEENSSQSFLGKINKDHQIVPLCNTKNLEMFSGIKPRNKEQHMLVDGMLNMEIALQLATGKAGTGKAQPLDAKILTPNGWVEMRSIIPGDIVLNPLGQHTKVLSVHPQGILPIYRITFSDGSSTECSNDHLWMTKTQKDRDYHKPGSIKTLADISVSLRYGTIQKRNHSIPMVKNISFRKRNIEIPPYLLGCLIGDGSISHHPMISNGDKDIIERCNSELKNLGCFLRQKSKYDWSICNINKSWNQPNKIANLLAKLDLFPSLSHTKNIPEDYLFNTIEARIALLQGLMDTDGTVDKRSGSLSFTTTSENLSKNFIHLIQSLGGKATISSRRPSFNYKGEKKVGRIAYTIFISLPNDIKPFYCNRKAILTKDKTKYQPTRYIEKIEFIGEKPAQCIYLDDPSHLYITDNFIVTHNTLLTSACGLHMLKRDKFSRLILTKPMTMIGKKAGLAAVPGDIKEKFEPYLINFKTNFETLLPRTELIKWEEQGRIQYMPIQLMLGASFRDTLIIADEAQNLTLTDMKALGTRIGENSKLVLLGDLDQIHEPDAKDLDKNNGLARLLNDKRIIENPLSCAIELIKGERSNLANLIAEVL